MYAISRLFASVRRATRWRFVVVRCGDVVAYDRHTHFGRMQTAQVLAELEDLGAVLHRLDVPVQLAFLRVVGGKQMPHSVRAGVGRRLCRDW